MTKSIYSLDELFINLRAVPGSGLVAVGSSEVYPFITTNFDFTAATIASERGLYVIVNKNERLAFVGSGLMLYPVLRNVRNSLAKRVHGNPELQRLFDQYGRDSFSVTTISIQDMADVVAGNQYLLNKFHTQGCCININYRTKVAGNGRTSTLDDTVYGCYTCTHKPSGGFYVGTAKNPFGRKHKHLYDLKKGTHVNPDFQDLWNSDPNEENYDWQFFIYGNRENAYEHEQRIIDNHNGSVLLMNRATNALDGLSAMHPKQREWAQRRAKEGAKHKLSRAITVMGIDYDSASAAAIVLNKNQTTVSRWANDPNDDRAYWREGPKKANGWTEEVRARARGENNSVAKRIVVDGKYYGSVKEAAAATGRDEKWLRHQARDRDVINIYWG